MTTIGWLFILAAAVILRSVFKGRVAELPVDTRDMLLGALRGDFEAVKEAAARTGEGLQPTLVAEGSPTVSGVAGGSGGPTGAALVAEMKRLGDGKRYVWSGTFAPGSGGGDCSGLVWRAVKNLGIYTGPRFTTFTFPLQSKKWAAPTTSPQPGDIVVWQRGGPKGHMGVVTGPDRFYSALSQRSGVREAPISSITGRITYYRVTK
jgi:cell wall-associated NlpC family hydrolase